MLQKGNCNQSSPARLPTAEEPRGRWTKLVGRLTWAHIFILSVWALGSAPVQKPFSGCKVCSAWRDAILKNHTSPEGEVFWKNIEPHLWFQEKWEVAKVFMTKGQKNKKSIGDFDIAALLSLMKQCKHFKKFELGGLCEKVSNVRNNIMHSAHFKLKQEDLHIYLHHIRALGEELAKYDLDFKSLLEDIDEIQNLDFRLVLPDNMAVEEIQAQHEKEREDILFAAVQLVENRNTEEYLRRKVERLEQRVSECDKEMQTLRLSNKTELRKLQERIDHCDRKMEKMQSAVAQKALEHNHTRMQLETLGRRMAQLEQETMANLDEQQTSSNMLVRALVTCICQSAIICENPCRLDVKQIKQLQKYLKDEQMELQALYALQALMVQMEHPDCLLRLFFDILYDEGMIKEEVFYKWESSRDPDEQQGKGMALRSVIAFFTWLREAEYDSESESESESDNSPPPCWENQWEFREDLLG